MFFRIPGIVISIKKKALTFNNLLCSMKLIPQGIQESVAFPFSCQFQPNKHRKHIVQVRKESAIRIVRPKPKRKLVRLYFYCQTWSTCRGLLYKKRKGVDKVVVRLGQDL